MIYNILIKPIELVVDLIFSTSYRLTHNCGISILFVSILINILVYPLYRRSDEIQEAAHQKQMQMQPWIDKIRKTFKGDERFFMLSAYYKEQHYKPIYALKSSVSLALQIPFFIAAYSYLSKLELLSGTGFLLIKDLGSPDRALVIGGFALNLLPLLMTAVNIISSEIYTKGYPIKEKLKLNAMAVIFLVLLYNSPSGLVLYWTMNNVFSLVKNIITRCVKNKARFMSAACSVFGLVFVFIGIKTGILLSVKRVIFMITVFCLLELPLAVYLLRDKIKLLAPRKKADENESSRLFVLCCLALACFMGLMIPLSVIKASPLEFYSRSSTPIRLLWSVFCVYAGIFAVWCTVFYRLARPSFRKAMTYCFCAAVVCGIFDYMLGGERLRNISPLLAFTNLPSFTGKDEIINILCVAAIISAMCVLVKRKRKIAEKIILTLLLCVVGISCVEFGKVQSATKGFDYESAKEAAQPHPIIPFSKTGKNVVVFMLDRAMDGYVPFIFNEAPELYGSYSGFVYYPNAIAYSPCTNYSAPSIFGGYEYTPENINKRDSERLVDKQNEALRVLPTIFGESGHTITVCDPPYANYQWIPDLSIYKGMPNVTAHITSGKYANKYISTSPEEYAEVQTRNFIYYSVYKAAPSAFQNIIYDNGNYCAHKEFYDSTAFMDEYSALCELPSLIYATNDEEGTLSLLQNSATHEPVMMSYPSYTPEEGCSEHPYGDVTERTVNGVSMKLENKLQITHYMTNLVTLSKVGELLDRMKELGVYDNTRIIIVADHGRDGAQFDYMLLSNGIDVQLYNPLFLVKDFNAEGDLRTSEEFMTIADVPSIAMEGVIENPVNPYTGNAITNDAKFEEAVIVFTSTNHDVNTNCGNVFDDKGAPRYIVKNGNIFDADNWVKIE